jgi:hypothetical protein
MRSKEDEMSFMRWRRLLGTELTIALEEVSKLAKDGANKRHQRYVGSCAVKFSWKNRIFNELSEATSAPKRKGAGILLTGGDRENGDKRSRPRTA